MHQKDIPLGWKKESLGMMVKIVPGIAAPNKIIGEGDIPFVRMKDLGDYHRTINFIKTEGLIKKEDAEIFKLPILKKGSILIPRSGSVHLNHRAVLGINAIIVSHIIALIPNQTEQTYFLYYVLCRYDMAKIMTRTTGLNAVSNDSLNKITFIVPERTAEQAKISETLIACDEAVEKSNAKINKLKKIKQGLMQDLFRYGIDEHGNVRSESTHRFKDSPFGRIPEEWDIQSISNFLIDGIIEDVQDGNHGELHPKSSDFVDEGVPFIMATDIAKNRIDFDNCKKISHEQYLKLRIGFAKAGDVLLSHKASIGFTAIVPDDCQEIMLTPQVTYYRIKDKEKLSNEYLKYYFETNVFQRMLESYAKQSTRNYIGILAQRNLLLIRPKKEEQNRIASILRTIDIVVETEDLYKRKLDLLKTGLMEDLLSGGVRVNHLIKEPA